MGSRVFAPTSQEPPMTNDRHITLSTTRIRARAAC